VLETRLFFHNPSQLSYFFKNCDKKYTFFFTTVDSEEGEEEEKELERDTSVSIENRIDELEEALEKEMRADRITSHFMHCLGGILKAIIRWYIWLRNKDHQD